MELRFTIAEFGSLALRRLLIPQLYQFTHAYM